MPDSQHYQQARLSRDRRFDGRFFVAVKTTGIFCRPICPATLPLEKNVEYFELAQQAMQQGYRPCLRCRPDSAPSSFAWQGTGTTVQRACQLLREHHTLSIQAIAAKLGIGERYFRQLFQQHLGLSPKQFQLFDQLLLAKQLLHQSQLSIEQVAQTCGFNSARRLQFQMKKLTQLSPSQIRQHKRAAEPGLQLNLAFRPPYNWPHMREFLRLRAIDAVEQINDTSYARSFRLAGCHGWFSATYQPDAHQFAVQIELSQLNALPRVLRNIERILDISADMQGVESSLLQAGLSPELITQGLRLPGIWDPFEAGCRAILGQQISVKAAINLLNQLVNQLGQSDQTRRYFPLPQDVATSALDFLKMPDSRRQTLRAFAHWCSENDMAEVEQWLQIKGIGPWTVAYAKMRGLSQPDIWLDSDLVIKHQLKRYALEPQLVRPWRSYLTLQLWNLA